MKNFIFLHIGLYVSGLCLLLTMPAAHAQDISINVLSNSVTLPLSTTGSIQVDLCNTGPSNVTAPANKLNPQISVGTNATILGVTNVDGSPLTNFTVLSNTAGQLRSNSPGILSLAWVLIQLPIRWVVVLCRTAPGALVTRIRTITF